MKTREYRTRDRLDKVFVVIFSIILFASGILTLVNVNLVPPSITISLVEGTILTWAFTLVISSPMAVLGRLTERFKLEALGSLGIGIGFLVYALSIAYASLPEALVALLFMAGFAIIFIYRAHVIRKLGREVDIQSGYSSLS